MVTELLAVAIELLTVVTELLTMITEMLTVVIDLLIVVVDLLIVVIDILCRAVDIRSWVHCELLRPAKDGILLGRVRQSFQMANISLSYSGVWQQASKQLQARL